MRDSYLIGRNRSQQQFYSAQGSLNGGSSEETQEKALCANSNLGPQRWVDVVALHCMDDDEKAFQMESYANVRTRIQGGVLRFFCVRMQCLTVAPRRIAFAMKSECIWELEKTFESCIRISKLFQLIWFQLRKRQHHRILHLAIM